LWLLAAAGLGLPLLWYVGLPVVPPALLYLSWRNFARPAESRGFLLRNCVGAPATLALVIAVTFALYFRVWEFVTPPEAPHGPAKFSLANSPAIRSYGGSAIVAVLPDGRLWEQRIGYNPGRTLLGIRGQTGIAVEGRWIRLAPEDTLVPGSNWVQAVANAAETVAIRSDGSLWVSREPVDAWGPPASPENRWPNGVRPPAPLVRFGTETGWQQVVRDTWHDSTSVVLLRNDGSLWRWSWVTRADKGAKPTPGLRNSEPHRLGAEGDWGRMMGVWSSIYVWKKDGSAWVLHTPDREPMKEQVLLEAEMAMERCQVFDNIRWRGLAQMWPLQLAVRDDGTLWAWYMKRPNEPGSGNRFYIGKPVQLGRDSDWVDVAASWRRIATLKADGSLWEWDLPRWYVENLLDSGDFAKGPPRQLGKHNDWVAVTGLMDGVVSAAADGNLWYWWGRNDYSSSQPMLKSSRRPEIIAEIRER
jgi:hypothetical protein